MKKLFITLIFIVMVFSYANSYSNTLRVTASNTTNLFNFLLITVPSGVTPCPEANQNWGTVFPTSKKVFLFKVKATTGYTCLGYYQFFPPSYAWTIHPISVKQNDTVSLRLVVYKSRGYYAFYHNGKPIFRSNLTHSKK